MFESLWFIITLLLIVHTHGALAANDIDEKVAIVIFAILIAIFTGIALVFAFLIIRLKRQDWQAVRDQYDAPYLNKRHSGVVKINSDHGITGFNQRHHPGLDAGVYERKTASDFSAVYVNPGYSNDLLTTTTSTFQQPNGKEEPPQDSTAVPNCGNTQNTSNGGHFITMNVSFVDEDSTVTQAHVETENVLSTAVDEKSDSKLPTTNGDIAVPTDTDKDVDSDKNNKSGIANGVAGDGKTHSSVAGSHQDPKVVTVSNTAAKRKSFGALFKRQESRESQKPLLFSQSSTVSSLCSITPESPAVGGLSQQMSSSAPPDTFNERDEQENEESEL